MASRRSGVRNRSWPITQLVIKRLADGPLAMGTICFVSRTTRRIKFVQRCTSTGRHQRVSILRGNNCDFDKELLKGDLQSIESYVGTCYNGNINYENYCRIHLKRRSICPDIILTAWQF